MDVDSFTSLSVTRLPSPCRLLRYACCPDKDLVVLVSRLGGTDRMSLWSMHGIKTWEVDLGTDKNSSEQLVDLAWSPDGQTIAVAHDPPRITLHSVQDGTEEGALPLAITEGRVVQIRWMNDGIPVKTGAIPDIFRRQGIITGSAHSILKMLPLVDNTQDDNPKLTATDLFAFQGSQTRSAAKSSVPVAISSWPALQSDHRLASLGSSPDKSPQPDTINSPTLLAATDNTGGIHCFLDGSYPVGVIAASKTPLSSVYKHRFQSTFFVHPQVRDSDVMRTAFLPNTIHLPFFASRKVRDLARSSTTAKELMWFSIRLIKEMRDAWVGSSSGFAGARDLGRVWVQSLERKQKDQFGRKEPNAMLDLTCLLVSGRASDALADFLGSGEQISERGIHKWETTLIEVLMKLRDYSEKRLAPAFQRLHLVMEEVHGWSLLPVYRSFELDAGRIKLCLELIRKGIILANWLAAAARRELSRFKEFIAWLRYEVAAVNPTGENNAPPHHDVLEVNNYFISGLQSSTLDQWFDGNSPNFSTQDLGVDGERQSLSSVLEQARTIANDPTEMTWNQYGSSNDLTGLDRNLDALTRTICGQAQRIFGHAAVATTKSAVITTPTSHSTPRVVNQSSIDISQLFTHATDDFSSSSPFFQYLILRMRSPDGKFLCFTRMRYDRISETPPTHVSVALVECEIIDEQGSRTEVDLLDTTFFDDQSMVTVFRRRGQPGPAFIATATFCDLEYKELASVKFVTQEDLILVAMEERENGQLLSTPLSLKRCRCLNLGEAGSAILAVNGRVGRRVACVLDEAGTTIECLDLESDEEDDDETGAQPDEA